MCIMIIRPNNLNLRCDFENDLLKDNAIYNFNSHSYNEHEIEKLKQIGLSGISMYFNRYSPTYIDNDSVIESEIKFLSQYIFNMKYIKENYTPFVVLQTGIILNLDDMSVSKTKKYLALKSFDELWENDFPLSFTHLKDKFIIYNVKKDDFEISFKGLIKAYDLEYKELIENNVNLFYLPNNSINNKDFLSNLLNRNGIKESILHILEHNGIWQLYFCQEEYGYTLIGKNLAPFYEEIQASKVV